VDAIAAHELLGRGLAEDTAEEDFAAVGVRSISHWPPYDRVGVVNADP
jgi:hypothetical protein